MNKGTERKLIVVENKLLRRIFGPMNKMEITQSDITDETQVQMVRSGDMILLT